MVRLMAEQTDSAFVNFQSPEHGIQALAELLDTYQRRYGLTTVEEMIARWAPGHENPTDAYATYVKEKVGGSEIDIRDPVQAEKMISAIIEFENSKNPLLFRTA